MSQAQLQLQRTILEYLEHTDAITSIKQQCEHFRSLQEPAFHFDVSIEPIDLLEHDAALGNLVLNNPTGASKFFQEVVFGIVQALDLLPTCESVSQVVVVFKLQSLPNLPSYCIHRSVDFIQHAKSKRFVQYRGIVCGVTAPHKYTKSARFICRENKCEGSEGNHFIRVHIPGALETQTIRSGFCCSFCASPLIEDVQCRVLADKVLVELVDEDAFCTDETKRYQSLTAYFRDELASGIEIGHVVHVIGLPILDVNNRVMALEANRVSIESNRPVLKEIYPEPSIPDSIASILKDRESSPWSFPLSLAYALGSSVSPPGTFLHLKLGMLLSLTSKDRGLDVLAVSHDAGEMVGRLLRCAGSLAPRTVYHGPSSVLTASVNKDTASGEALIHGGSLLLAHGGVCVIPNMMDTLKKSTLSTLLQVVESGSMTVELPARLSSNALGPSIRMKRCCAVWTSCSSSPEPANQRKLNSTITSADPARSSLTALADAFRMLYPVDVGVETYADHVITHYTILSSMQPPAEVVPHEHIKQYLQVVHHRPEPELSEAAERLIKGYYVASRRVREDSSPDNNIPITAVHTISRLSVCHAALCLRAVVLDTDAAAAILLYEESIATISGVSVLNVQPLVHVKDNNIQAYIGDENDRHMLHFLQHLQLFIANHADLDCTCNSSIYSGAPYTQTPFSFTQYANESFYEE